MNSLFERLRYRLFHALCVPAIALSGLALPALAGDVLYATGGCGLYTVDTATGAATQVWCFPGVSMYAGGLAYDASTDKLFAIGVLDSSSGTTRLFSIDRFTGVLTSYPGMGSNVNLTSGGLAIHPLTGVMYATGGNGFQSTALFTIDKNTGAETLIGQNGGQCCVAPFGFNMNGLGFRDNGTLYANGFTLSGMSVPDYSHLFTIDLASGLASDIGTHGVSVGRLLAYSGLAFASNGTLYSMGSISSSQNGLYTVDPATGLATLVGDLVLPLGCDGGLTFAPDGMPTAYCTAKVNSQGCVPGMSFTGAPSATNPAPFTITAT
ncbi:MAG TPA: hypothetical protein VK843_11100, partial [Planctomycetota bacterium]|nr:hypothetical protein [Planctomycetota bacterium]